MINLPERIESESQLDDLLTRPRAELVESVARLDGTIMILGAGGKMGPTLAVLLRRAADAAGRKLRIIAASRFASSIRSGPAAETKRWLDKHGIETVACDLLERKSVEQLPDASDILYLVGLKFGTHQNPSLTWATNVLAPAHVAERFPRARIAALSTGNVYPLVPVAGRGATETDPLTPLGEYANAAVARERVFEYESLKYATRMVLLRLNYAVDLRYGVLVDIAQKVWNNEPIDVTMGHLNCIWQGDANELIVRALELAATPPAVFNLTGTRALPIRELALRFGDLMSRRVNIVGHEADTALLSDSSALCAALGEPATPLDAVLRWTAQWVSSGGVTYGKPTHFEIRDGKY